MNNIILKKILISFILTIINSIAVTILIISAIYIQFKIWGKIIEPNLILTISIFTIITLLFGGILILERLILKNYITTYQVRLYVIIELILLTIFALIYNGEAGISLYYMLFIIPLSIFTILVKNNLYMFGMFCLHLILTIGLIVITLWNY